MRSPEEGGEKTQLGEKNPRKSGFHANLLAVQELASYPSSVSSLVPKGAEMDRLEGLPCAIPKPGSALPGCSREARGTGRGLGKDPGVGSWWLLQPGKWDLSPCPSLTARWGVGGAHP